MLILSKKKKTPKATVLLSLNHSESKFLWWYCCFKGDIFHYICWVCLWSEYYQDGQGHWCWWHHKMWTELTLWANLKSLRHFSIWSRSPNLLIKLRYSCILLFPFTHLCLWFVILFRLRSTGWYVDSCVQCEADNLQQAYRHVLYLTWPYTGSLVLW